MEGSFKTMAQTGDINRENAANENTSPKHMTASAEPSPFKFGYYYDIDKDEADRNDPQLYYGELHILLFGLNGAGKSTRILVENLVTLKNRSLVVIDVKGELAAQTARTRRTLSAVTIINP